MAKRVPDRHRAGPPAESATAGAAGGSGGTSGGTSGAAVLVALASFIPAAKVSSLKKTLPRGESIDVDATVRVRGVVQVGLDEPGTPGESGERPADTPELLTPNLVSEVLRRLKVTPGKLRAALKAATKHGPRDYTENEENAKLLAVFEEVAQAIAADLPPVEFVRPGKPGRAAPVRVSAEVEVLDTNQ